MSQIAFTRDKTAILKGFALILMLIHHVSNPAYWAEIGSPLYGCFQHLVYATKMCVYIFAFLVGYGFFCSKNKTLRYSFKRILLILVPFWTMMLCMFIPAAYLSGRLSNALSGSGLHAGIVGGGLSLYSICLASPSH